MKKNEKTEIICKCNNISRETIEQSIRDGAKTMNEIFDMTTAGVGPCGGSCRNTIVPILEHYLATGEFLPSPNANRQGKHQIRPKR